MTNRKKYLFTNLRTTFVAMLFCLGLLFFTPLSANAATQSNKDAFKQELRTMLYSADDSTHDVLKYKLTFREADSQFSSLKSDANDKWMIASYYSNMYISYTFSDGYVSSIKLNNVDNDVLNRYERLKKNVASIKAGIEDDMTDLDKVIYLHDALIDLTTYKYVAYQSYGAGGALGDQFAVCSGYTKALNYLLNDQGIDAKYVSSSKINHAWTLVKISGEWYHIDSTWDDTRSSLRGTAATHKFLLKNDSEFVTSDNNSHVEWYVSADDTLLSTSTRFSNWYVSSITGKMAFEDGYWYYVDTTDNCILRNNADGTDGSIFYDGSNDSAITLVDATSDGVVYKENGTTSTLDYDYLEEIIEIEEEEAETEVITGDSEIEVVDEPKVKETNDASFYLLKSGCSRPTGTSVQPSSNYMSVGTGKIYGSQNASDDDELVASLIAQAPDVSSYLADGEEAVWYVIKKAGGTWHVDGEIVEKSNITVETSNVVEQEVVKETETTTVMATVTTDGNEKTDEICSASFYLLKSGCSRPTGTSGQPASNYMSVGTGTLTSYTNASDNDEMVASLILKAPDVSSYLSDNEKVVWYVIKKAGSVWHVDGEIVECKNEETLVESNVETTTEVTETTTYDAGFYLLKNGCSRPTGTNAQPSSNYMSVGSGKIYSQTNAGDDDKLVASLIAQAPDCSSYLSDNQYVVWYVIKKAGSSWHVDGEIVNK